MGNQASVRREDEQQVEEPKLRPRADENKPQEEDPKKQSPSKEVGPEKEKPEKAPQDSKVAATRVINLASSINSINNNIPTDTLKQKSQEEKSAPKSITIPAKELSITWSEDRRYWTWQSLKDPASNTEVQVACLLNVCWLEVRGKLDISKLTPGTVYEIVFTVMLKDPAYGWEVPVTLKLVSPQGTQAHQERLLDKMRGRWIELQLGEISRPSDGSGEAEFSLVEIHGGQWKRGLVIKEAVIRPKDRVV